jgi:hypothetical protein
MALDSDQIVVAGTGEVYVAPVGTAAPSGATALSAAFSASWVGLGYTTEDGVRFSDTPDITDVNAWQSQYPVRRLVGTRANEFSFTALQWNSTTVSLAFGGGTWTEPTAGIFKYAPPATGVLDERAMAVEWQDGSYKYRLIVPKGTVSGGVEFGLTRTEAAQLPLTFSTTPTGTGDAWYLLTDDPELDPTA